MCPWQAPSICPAGHPSYRGRRCPKCEDQRKKAYDKTRPNAARRLYDAEWQRESKAFLAIHRFCVDCDAPATVVDHIVPHRGNARLFWDRSNWAPRCKPHHDRKTALEDSFFAGPRA